ncbi:MAG: acylphosphatase [Planctomycetota bacterium]
MTRVHAFVSGRVQGVWFRASTREEALRLGLTGWVRNLPDGRVEFVAEGDEDAIEALLAWCRSGGPPMGRVDDLKTTNEAPSQTFTSFEVTG